MNTVHTYIHTYIHIQYNNHVMMNILPAYIHTSMLTRISLHAYRHFTYFYCVPISISFILHTYIHTYIHTASENTEFFSRGMDYTKQGEEILEAAFSLSQLLNGLKTAGVVTYAGTVTGTAYSAFANMPVTYTYIHTYIHTYILTYLLHKYIHTYIQTIYYIHI